MGVTKSGVDAVAVYYANKETKKFKKSEKFFIAPNASVYTINDKTTNKPKLYPVKAKDKNNKEFSFKLVQVAFKNLDSEKWYRGFVLSDCFDWDASKNLDESTINSAVDSTDDVQGVKVPLQVQTSKNICKM